jgi:hypothetical protein
MMDNNIPRRLRSDTRRLKLTMKNTKSLYLTFDLKSFEKLKAIKEKEEKTSKERIAWERFVFGKVIKQDKFKKELK